MKYLVPYLQHATLDRADQSDENSAQSTVISQQKRPPADRCGSMASARARARAAAARTGERRVQTSGPAWPLRSLLACTRAGETQTRRTRKLGGGGGRIPFVVPWVAGRQGALAKAAEFEAPALHRQIQRPRRGSASKHFVPIARSRDVRAARALRARCARKTGSAALNPPGTSENRGCACVPALLCRSRHRCSQDGQLAGQWIHHRLHHHRHVGYSPGARPRHPPSNFA